MITVYLNRDGKADVMALGTSDRLTDPFELIRVTLVDVF